MVLLNYKAAGRTISIDPKVYRRAKSIGLDWAEVFKETARLKAINHPSATYNFAASLLIAQKEKPFLEDDLGLFKPLKSKKGFVGDNVTLFVVMLILLSFLVLFVVVDININDQVQAGTQDQIVKDTFALSSNGLAGAIDKAFIVGLVIMVSFMLYSAYTIGSNFGLFLIALLMNIVALFLLPIGEDYLVSTFYNNNYATVIAQMRGMYYIINHYTIVLTGISVLLLIAFFVRPSSSGVAE